MNDQNKSKEQLVTELAEMRQRIVELEEARNGLSETNSHLAPGDRQWHSLTANTPVVILILDRNHRIRFVNHTESGGSPDKVIGRTPYDFCQPETHDTVRECLDRGLETGESGMYEIAARRLDGQEHWYESHVGPIVEDGKVVALSIISFNASARKQAEQERDRAHAILNAAIECLPFHFFALNSDGRYTLQNVASRQHYGDVLGKTPEEICPSERDLALWLDNNRRAFTGERVEDEVELTVRGENRHYHNIVAPISDGDTTYGILGVNVDITERKRAEQALQEAHDELEQRVEERTTELAKANEQLRREIEERKQAEEDLRSSEERYRALVEASPDAVVMADLEGRITFASQRMADLYGSEHAEELYGRHALDFIAPEDHQKFQTFLLGVLEQGIARDIEVVSLKTDGTYFASETSGALIRDASGSPKALMGLVRDITERKQAQDALQQSHDELRTIHDGMADGLVVVDIETKGFLRVNQAMCRMLGYSEEELLSMSVTDIHPPKDLPDILRKFETLSPQPLSMAEDIPMLRKDGSVFYADITNNKITYRQRSCVIGFLRDITERKQAQEALQREQDSLRRMLRASDRERQLITYEIHDSVAQRLVGALMQFQAYEQAEDREAESAKAQFEAGMNVLREASADARSLMNRTRTPVLDKYSIATAIADLIDHFMDVPDSPEITYHSDVSFNRLAPVLENAIYRVAQEAIANACIHSKSKTVRVTLTQVDEGVTLEVQDWGTGFDEENVEEDRFGLDGIRERARLLGKDLLIESTPGQGTRIRATFPLLEKNNNVIRIEQNRI